MRRAYYPSASGLTNGKFELLAGGHFRRKDRGGSERHRGNLGDIVHATGAPSLPGITAAAPRALPEF